MLALCGCGGSFSPDKGQTKSTAIGQKSKTPEPSPPNAEPLDLPPKTLEKTQPPKPEAAPLVGRFQPETVEPPKAKIYRPADTRPVHKPEPLAELGIRRYVSRHLELFTDIDPQFAEPLPKLVDQLYAALENYFGPLPPDRANRTFQMTGYLMADQRLFRETNLLPEDLRAFNHGRHRGAEFWLNDQEYDYYRRHLLLHEATHCFMTIMKEQNLLPPVWYMEGMAEHFGTHHIATDGTAAFRVMPDDKETFAGWGRISLVQTAIKEGRFHTLDQVLAQTANDYNSDEAYAWSWAVCKFLDTHPRTRKPFQSLGEAATRREFVQRFQEAFLDDMDNLRTEWALFAHDLDYGYQIEPAAITFLPGQPLAGSPPQIAVEIRADRGWQSSGVLIEQGQKYTLSATGEFTLAQLPKPWVSQADGISFRYFGGQPLGRLQACLRTKIGNNIATAEDMRRVFSCGAHHTLIATQTGTLYLRLNDDPNQRDDNTGQITVEIHRD